MRIILLKKIVYILIIFLNTPLMGAEVYLKEEAKVSLKKIYLKDIAKIYNASPSLAKKLKSIYIGESPILGRSKVYHRKYIKMRLAPFRKIKIKGASEVLVSTDFQILNLEELKEKVKRYLHNYIGEFLEGIEIEFFKVPEKIIIPKGKVTLHVGFRRRPRRLFGNIYLPVRIDVSGRKYKVIMIGVKIRRFSRVVVANNDLERGDILNKEDVRLAFRETTFLPSDVLTDLELAINKKINHRVKKDTPICRSWIEAPPIIKRGDKVDITVKMNNVLVKTKGIAREDGVLGEIIKIRNISSKKVFQAKVVGRNLVLIE